MKRHVGGLFCFLGAGAERRLGVYRLNVRIAGIPEVADEAKKRSGEATE
jgi:hypothetical protein